MPRTILHVDMDAFYTSIEQRDHPELRGRPVIVGADPKGGRGRGVVAAASYEARKFGVRSAMPISRAYRACPQAVYLGGDMRKYADVSARIMAILETYTDLVEPLSIDEAFLDASAISVPEKGKSLGAEIKESIFQQEGLKASVGVAPNKFLAKIASDLEKPDGLVAVLPGGELEFLRELPIERLWGVGPKTAEGLRRAGLRRISDLWPLRAGDPVVAALGKHGEHLLALARGIDEREVVRAREAKSIGHETTFEEDTDDPARIRSTLLWLSDAVAARLRRHRVRGRTVTLKFRDQSFVTETRSLTLREATDDASSIFASAIAQLDRVATSGRKVRLLGVSLSNLQSASDPYQLSLFGREEKSEKLNRARDAVEARFGKGALGRLSLLEGAPPREEY
jgi:nucleotidyltransferase/DNA polymerase involved in DNA repair